MATETMLVRFGSMPRMEMHGSSKVMKLLASRGDWSGVSVSLSSDGQTLAVGGPTTTPGLATLCILHQIWDRSVSTLGMEMPDAARPDIGGEAQYDHLGESFRCRGMLKGWRWELGVMTLAEKMPVMFESTTGMAIPGATRC